MSNPNTYMDYAAATPVDASVAQAMQPFLSDLFYNPSSVYLASRAIRTAIDEARADVAHWLGARPSEIVFTAGATEANNIALIGSRYEESSHTVTTTIEHEAILAPLEGRPHTLVAVDGNGIIQPAEIKHAITSDTTLVTIVYANNEIGTVQHMSDIAACIQDIRDERKKNGDTTPLLFHTDASQAPNYLDLHVDKLGVDLMTLNGGKMYGPKQCGVLYVRAGVELVPMIRGGGQERNVRSGTENVAGIIGFATALQKAQKMRKEEGRRLRDLSQKLQSGLEEHFEDASILGHKKHRLPNITSVIIPGIDGERVVMMLDELGFQVATGSACGAMRDESSHVVKALGRTEEEAQATLRISLGRGSKETHIDSLLKVLPDCIKEARSLH